MATKDGIYVPYVTVTPADASADVEVTQVGVNRIEIPLERWSHIAASYDEASGQLSLLIDGVRVGNAVVDNGVKTHGYGPVYTRLGEGFDGYVDEVRIWSRARSIYTIANGRHLQANRSDRALMGYFTFDDGGVTAQDMLATYQRDWREDWVHAGALFGDAIMVEDAVSQDVPIPDRDVDSDGDGIADSWEIRYFDRITATNGQTDFDGDGLTDYYEYLAPTHPLLMDTNNDGVNDDLTDSDGDLLTNLEEQEYRTHPGEMDTDDDGLSDREELLVADDALSTLVPAGETSPRHSMSPAREQAFDLSKIATQVEGVRLPFTNDDLVLDLSSWTVEAWFYSGAAATQTGSIVRKQVGTLNQFDLGVTAGVPYVSYETSEGIAYSVTAAAAVADGEWVHLAGVWDGTARVLRLYINATTELEQTFRADEQDIEPVSGYGRTTMGAGGAWTDAVIDEVRIWNTIRTQDDIDAARHEFTYWTDSGLTRYYRFDDGGLSIEDFAHNTTFWDFETYSIAASDYLATPDTDGDGTADWVVATTAHRQHGMDDADGDGMADWFESLYSVQDAGADEDEDWLTNAYEFLSGTNPIDSVDNSDATADSDSDGVSNLIEQQFGTDPRLVDTDNDGLTDGEEILGVNNTSTALVPLARPNVDTYASDPLSALDPPYRDPADLSRGGRSLKLDGATQFVTLPNLNKYAVTEWTLEAHVLPTAAQSGVIVSRRLGTTATNYEMGLALDGGMLRPFARFVALNGSVVNVGGAGSVISVPLNEWSHVAASYDPAIQTLTLYVDGMPVDETIDLDRNECPVTGDGIDPASSKLVGAQVTVGKRADAAAPDFFAGNLDEVRVWGVVRTPDEVFQDFRGVIVNSTGRLSGYAPAISGASVSSTTIQQALSRPHAASRLLVAYDETVNAKAKQSISKSMGVKILDEISLTGVQVVEIADNTTLAVKLAQYRDRDDVLYAEPDYRVQPSVIPNDPRFGELWGMDNTGQTGGTPGADIGAVEAWNTTVGSRDIIVAVIDTGIDYNHPDLAANMWVNAGEVPGNGVDDDGNGFVDDVHGYDFANNDGDPWDDHYHGTHCAGTIGAVGDNGIGVSGVSWRVRLMAVKNMGLAGGLVSDSVRALDYAVQMGAHVTSNSYGGYGFSQAMYDAIGRAKDAGQLFVAAASNDSNDNDINPAYPASYDHENIISVAATDHNDQFASFSNYGATTVDLSAPGVNILSTFPNNTYSAINGTSMACPHVAGAAALLYAATGATGWETVKDLLLNGVDPLPVTGRVLTDGRLNIQNSLLSSTAGLIAYLRSDSRWHDASSTDVVKDLTEADIWLPDYQGLYAGVLENGALIDDAASAMQPGDVDGDGIPDWYETARGLNAIAADGDLDLDGDGLTNYYEYLANTDPYNPISVGTTPDGAANPDGDSLTNLLEQTYGTNPVVADADTDDDGVTDNDELTGAFPSLPMDAMSPYVSRVLMLRDADDMLVLPNQPRFALVDSWTVEAWVRLDGTEADGGVILSRRIDDGQDDSFSSVNYELGLDAGLNPYVRYTGSAELGHTEVIARSQHVVQTNLWTHIAGVFDAAASTLTIYVNSIPYWTTNTYGIVPAAADIGRVSTVVGGDDTAINGDALLGAIDSLRIWAVARTTFADAAVSATGFDGTADLVAFYRFDDGEAATNGSGAQDFTSGYENDWLRAWFNAGELVNGALMPVSFDSPADLFEDDTDGDGLPDWWELNFFGDLLRDGLGDLDGDGLNDLYEYLAGTDPTVIVTFNDGLIDANRDADNDGLSNAEEQVFGTLPGNPDTDDDGVSDGDEVVGDPDGAAGAVAAAPQYMSSPVHSMGHYDPILTDSLGNQAFCPDRSLDLGVVSTAVNTAAGWDAYAGITVPEGSRVSIYPASDARTFEAWVRPSSTDVDGGAILSYRIDGRIGLELGLNASAEPYVMYETDGGTVYFVGGMPPVGGTPLGNSVSVSPLAYDTWHHVAAVRDPDVRGLSLYVDGLLQFTLGTIELPGWFPTRQSEGELYLGGTGVVGGGRRLEAGLLDEVRVWGEARTRAQLEANRDTVLPVTAAGTNDPLLVYYRFDDAGINIEDFAWAHGQIVSYDYILSAANYDVGDADSDGTSDWVVPTDAKHIRGWDDQDGDDLPDWWESAFVVDIDETTDGVDNDGDGAIDDLTGIYATPETNLTDTVDNDNDGVVNDGPNDPAGSPETDLPADIVATADNDGDGLTNLYEHYCRTNPWSIDTDGDGVLDGDEDFDGDELPNIKEEQAGTDPRLPDTDDDGLSDGEEAISDTSPVDALSPERQHALYLPAGGYVDMPMSGRFALGSWTVETWVFSEAVTADVPIIARTFDMAGTVVNYVLGLKADRRPYAAFTAGSGTVVEVVASPAGAVGIGEWVHVAATFDVANSTLSLYRNSELITSKGTSYTSVTNGPGPVSVRIGSSAGGFAGYLDDVRIYGAALDKATLEARMRDVLLGDEADLVAYYRFDDSTSKGAADFGHVEDFAMPGGDWLNEWANAGSLRGGAVMVELTGTTTPTLGEHPFTQDEDSDIDDLPDWWELQYFGDLLQDGTGDADGDGLNDFYEYLSRTSPLEFDTDSLGTPDKFRDPDSDTLWNIEEQDYGTHPYQADTDDDGDGDAYETFQANDGFGTNPTDSLDPLVRQVGSFDGVQDYVRVEENPDLGAQAFALSFWIRPGATGPATILEKHDAEAPYYASNGTRTHALNYQVSLTSTNQLRFEYHKASSGRPISVTTRPTDTIGLHEWTLVIINYDHTAGVLEIHLLVPQGENYEARSRQGSPGGIPVSGLGDLYIGASYVDVGTNDIWSTASHFRGDLDEIAVWSRMLTAGDPLDPTVPNDFDTLYNNGVREGIVLGLVGAQPTELLAYYMFDDGGQTLEDFVHPQDWLLDWTHAGVVNGSIFVAGGLRDNDDDGLPNWFELVYSQTLQITPDALGGEFDLNPNNNNTDGDVFTDGTEDFDYDWLTNVEEYNGADGGGPELGVAEFNGTSWVYGTINPDRIVVDPPNPPEVDEWYFVDAKVNGTAPSGVWVGHVGDLARYTAGAWTFIDVSGEPPASPVAGSVFITGVVTEVGIGGVEEIMPDDGTSPVNDDTDGDGVQDGLEVARTTLSGVPAPTNPLLVDSDDDGLSDLEEELSNGNPLSSLEPLKKRSLQLGTGGYMEVQGRNRHQLEVFTIEAWVKPAAAGSTGVILRKASDGATVNYELGLNAGKPYVMFTPVTGNTASNQRVEAAAELDPATDWHHVAGVLSATTGTAGLWLYVDGQPMGRLIVGIDPRVGDGNLTIGAAAGGFEGLVDEVRVWSIARTTTDIGQRNNFTLAGTETGLVAYFRMDDAEWPTQSASPYVQAYGAEDFTQPNDFRASAIGNATYAFVEDDVPQLEEVDTDNDGMPDFWEKMHGLDPADPNDGIGDPDGDGLVNLDEYRYGANPNNPDTDSDGLDDNWEVTYLLDPAKADSDDTPPNDSLSDLDSDSLTNQTEYNIGTNPRNLDTDGDGLPDGWEYTYDLDPLDNGVTGTGTTVVFTEHGAGGDPDADGLTNADELLLQTHPRNADTDGDQLRDGWEVLYDWDPRLADSDGDGTQDGVEDPDRDGLSNTGEQNSGTDPLSWDTDGDELPDGWEVAQVRSDGLTLNPLDATGIFGRDGDPDNDTWTNYQEFLLGTDPWVSNVADQAIDRDNDNLADWEETLHNTDPQWPDTDDDGVGDYEEVRVNTRGYDSLSKEAISNFVDLNFSNTLDYNGNRVANVSRDQFLAVDLTKLDDEGIGRRHLALSSWTIEARVRVDVTRLNEYMSAVAIADRVATGDRLVIIQRGFTGSTDVNYELGLRAVVQNGSAHFYPYTRWFRTTERVSEAENDMIAADEWVHLTGRFNAEDNTLTLYKNGTEIARETQVTGFCPTVDQAATPSAFIRVGEGFFGDIDEVRIWGVQDPEVQLVMGDPAQMQFNSVTTGQVENLVGVVRTADEIAYNHDRSVMPTRGVYDASLRDHFDIVVTTPDELTIDRRVTDTPWTTVSGQPGRLAARAYYEDANGNDSWDAGEDVWLDSSATGTQEGQYDDLLDTQVAAGADGWTALTGAIGRAVSLYYNDANSSVVFDVGEDAWLDYRNTASWYTAQRAPWARAAGLLFYLKFDDEGEHIEDFAWHADWRDQWSHSLAVPSTEFKLYDGNRAPVTPTIEIVPGTADHHASRDALLRAEIVLHSSDPDDHRVIYRYRWHRREVLDGGNGSVDDRICVMDANANGKWDFGEDVWYEMNELAAAAADYTYSWVDADGDGAWDSGEGDMIITDGGDIYGWQTATGTTRSIVTQLSYHDANTSLAWDDGEDIWQDGIDVTGDGIADGSDGVYDRDVDRLVSALSGQTSSILDLGSLNAAAFETYAVSVVAVDELGAVSEAAWDYVVTTVKTSPVPPGIVSFTPAQALPFDDDSATDLAVVLRNTNVQEATSELNMRWYRNHEYVRDEPGQVVAYGETATFTLEKDLLIRGDVWYFRAYTDDLDGGISALTSRETVVEGTTEATGVRVIGGAVSINLGPSQPSVLVAPERPLVEDMLICLVSGSEDAERDYFAYYYQWSVLDTTLGAYVEAVGETNPVLLESATTTGQRWRCQVYAEDVFGNRSVTASSNVVLIETTPTGVNAYEDNDTLDTAHRILPKADPESLADPAVQTHAIFPENDMDWFWFIVSEDPAYEKARVIFETNSGLEMWDTDHSMVSDMSDTAITLFDPDGSQLYFIDDWGIKDTYGATRWARFDLELDPGIYYARVSARSSLDTIQSYAVHLMIEPVPGAKGPTEPAAVVITPTEPNSSDDLVCTSTGASSGLGEGQIKYWYVWYRDGRVAVLPPEDGQTVPDAAIQPFEGVNYELAYRRSSNVLSSTYTKAGETWSCKVYATDANGESLGVQSADVVIGEASWVQSIRVEKTFNDGTPSVLGDDQAVVVGWLFGATHGFDVDIDADLPPENLPSTGTLPAGRAYSIGLESEHLAMTRDIRPFGSVTSWYLKIELGDNPVGCTINWDSVVLPITDTPLTITRVDEVNDFQPIYGTTVDMLETTQITLTQAEIESMLVRGERDLVYRVNLGGGDAFQRIDLVSGWNMISFSLLPTSPAVSDVFTFNGQRVNAGSVWEYKNGGYIEVSEIEPTRGYWVYCPFEAGASVTVYGLRVGGTIPLVNEWNLVGPVKNVQVNSDAVIVMWYYKDGVYKRAYTASAAAAASQAGQELDEESIGMQVGYGYWIYSNRRANLPAE